MAEQTYQTSYPNGKRPQEPQEPQGKYTIALTTYQKLIIWTTIKTPPFQSGEEKTYSQLYYIYIFTLGVAPLLSNSDHRDF